MLGNDDEELKERCPDALKCFGNKSVQWTVCVQAGGIDLQRIGIDSLYLIIMRTKVSTLMTLTLSSSDPN